MNGVWLAIGLAGQIAFGARFLVQWVASERRGRSVIPMAFWWLSLGGGVILLSYAIHRRDPVFILGQSFGLVVYARNIVLIRRRRSRAARQRWPDGARAPAGDPHAPAGRSAPPPS